MLPQLLRGSAATSAPASCQAAGRLQSLRGYADDANLKVWRGRASGRHNAVLVCCFLTPLSICPLLRRKPHSMTFTLLMEVGSGICSPCWQSSVLPVPSSVFQARIHAGQPAHPSSQHTASARFMMQHP